MEIRLLSRDDLDALIAASALFDHPVDRRVAERFLETPGHLLLVAYDEDRPVGFVSGIEMTHPDKGTEMFLYELGVEESSRRQGIGTALVTALADLAREHSCYAMWLVTDADNAAAVATYGAAGAPEPSEHVMFSWDFKRSDPT